MTQGWWIDFFDMTYAPLLMQRSEEELAHSAALIMQQLQLTPGQRVYEQCCGMGQLAMQLAQAGLQVEAVDISGQYIEAARTAINGHDCKFEVADAYEHVPRKKCDAVINWYSSFGYGDDVQNQRMAECAYAALKPGGHYLIETTNPAFVLMHFMDQLRQPYRLDGMPAHVERESGVDLERGMLTSYWSFPQADGTAIRKYGESRMYLPPDYKKMLSACGFDAITFSGGDGETLSDASPRLMIRARRS